MAADVTMYTTNTCAYCVAVKDFFKSKDVEYTEVNLNEHPERGQELIDISGQMAVPVIVVTKDDGSKDVTVGYNVPKLSAALGL